MEVFKFGGASVRNASTIKKVAHILGIYKQEKLLVVVSAMGKTTNALEKIVGLRTHGKGFQEALQSLKRYHQEIMTELFQRDDATFDLVEDQFKLASSILQKGGDHDFVYDQVVSLGEVISTLILSSFLKTKLQIQWIDARKYISTDSTFLEGKVDWIETEKRIRPLRAFIENNIVLTQGFIGADQNGNTTTLGREGSDFSAAVFASCLDAESVTIWKDVPGVMNADPKRMAAAQVFEELPFKEAAEMTYYGASVIHPKTIKPLAIKNIPLLVKNFDDPSLPGTRIHDCIVHDLPPLIIFKDNQCLISCKVTDYTFIEEGHLSIIFQSLAKLDIKINLMQNSAISFSVCVDFREQKVLRLIEALGKTFEVYYNTGLTLITLKNYDSKTANEYRSKAGIILEQSSRSTLQLLVRDSASYLTPPSP